MTKFNSRNWDTDDPTFAAQSLLSNHSSGVDLSEVLLPIAVTVGVVLLSLLLFLYYICRLVSPRFI